MRRRIRAIASVSFAIAAWQLVAAPAAAQTYVAGTPVFGANDYIEYIPGNLPIIVSAPHGGALQPASIPLRTSATCGENDFSTVRDLNTEELARAIQAAFYGRTGKYPHIIINKLHRNRLDANRPVEGAACGNADAEQAWHEFNDFLEVAKAAVVAEYGKGWYTDIHGHGHAIQRLELGYNLTATALRSDDAELDGEPAIEAGTSIKAFSQESPRSFSALLRGPTALGTLFENGGYRAVPSQRDPAPEEGAAFFSGGHNTRTHGCMNGGTICGLQIECNLTGVRDTATNRANFAMKLVEVYDEYLSTNFAIYLPDPPPPTAPGDVVIVDNLNANNDPDLALFRASTNWVIGNNTQSWADNFQLAQASGSATNDGAEFYFRVTRPGTYSVDAWWPAVATRSQSASYRVFEVDLGTLFLDTTKNQRLNGAQWNSLGTFDFTKVSFGKVLMSRSLSGAGSLAADAIRATLISAPNRAPYARLAAPISALEGSAVAYDGSRSFDLDHDPLTHAWSFSDGGSSTSPQLTHTFVNNGHYDVTLSVADSLAAVGTMTRTIAVANVAPAINAIASATILQGETYTSTGTFADPGADTWTATVDYGDGGGAGVLTLDGQQFSLSHIYPDAGTFGVAVDVFDGDDHGTTATEVVVQTPGEAMAGLAAMVDASVASGDLSAGNGRSLVAKLSAAATQLEKGHTHPAMNQLGAFINETNALIHSGRVPATVSAWSDLAQRIIQSLSL